MEIISDPHETVLKFGEGIASFFSFTQATTFAPNLVKLAITTLKVDAEEYNRWITMFLSPTLLDLELVYYGDYDRLGLDSSSAPQILKVISAKCPKIRKLDIFPREDVDNYEFEWDSKTKPTKADMKRSKMLASLRVQMSSFRDLRSLKSSVLMLKPDILTTLGELPSLETLSIDGDCREPRIVDLTLPDTAFPALRTLELLNFHTANLRYMSEFSPLLRRLKKIVMVVGYDDNISHYGWEDDGEDDWTSKLISSVAKNAPLLTDLAVDYSTLDCEACLSSDLLDSLRGLRLRRLDLQNIEIECGWSCVAASLPNLQEIRTSDLSCGQISQLAKRLPQLRLLELDSIDIRSFAQDMGEDDEDEENEGGEEEDEDEGEGEGEEEEEEEGEGSEDGGKKKPRATCASKDKAITKLKGRPLQLKAAYESSSGMTTQELQKIAR